MVAIALSADAPFFEEWSRLHRTSRRSIARAAAFADALGIDLRALPAMVVVGSKGKATAATYASASLAAAGFRVGTISSPPIVTNRERIRLNGVAIGLAEYEALANVVEDRHSCLSPPSSPSAKQRQAGVPVLHDDGYLSPAGLYMIAGLHWLQRQACDVFVVEAGMGGRSDEVSLLAPRVVAVTPIFGEHLGVLGHTVADIAEEKLGVISDATRAVISAPQSAEVVTVFARFGIDAQFVDGAMHAANAAVGLAAAKAWSPRASTNFDVHLPGRLTSHVDEDRRRWVVDAAVNATGVANAVQYPRDVERVLVSLPDSKDVAATAQWLDANLGRDRWRPVMAPHAEHLSYSSAAWGRELLRWREAHEWARERGSIVAAGSWSFISAVLHALGVDNERAFSVR